MSDCLDCKDSPFKGTGATVHGSRMSVFAGVKNPIEAEITDTDEVRRFFSNYRRLVPFAGSAEKTGHRVLNFYDLCYRMSPTHGSCIGKKNIAAFGGMATTIRLADPDFDTGEDVKPPTPDEKRAYREALKSVKFDRQINEFAEKISTDFQAYGNAWMELKMTQVNGQYRASMKLHQYDHVLYLLPPDKKDDTPKEVVISPKLSLYGTISPADLESKDVEIMPVYPAFKNDNGVLRSMFHLRGDGFTFYGRPESQASDASKYEEVMTRMYRLKNTQSGFSAGIIIEVASPNPVQEQADLDEAARAQGYSNWAEMFRANFTNRGDNSQGIMFMRRTENATPFEAHNVTSNTNGAYFKDIANMNQMDIIASHGVTGRFMSVETSGRYAQNSAFMEDYVLNVAPTINRLRRTVCSFINEALTAFWNYSGQQVMNEQSLWFNGPFDVIGDSTQKNMTNAVMENKTNVTGNNDQDTDPDNDQNNNPENDQPNNN